MIPTSELLSEMQRTFDKGGLLMRENDFNDSLYIILDGFVSHLKGGKDFNTIVDTQGPGDFVGLLSFHTGEPVFTSAMAITKVLTLSIDRDSLDVLLEQYPAISKTLQGLIFSNLAERYRRVVTLHIEVERLSKELENEKVHLQKTISELARTRNMLISKEKMAILGELTAGLAHEINNPLSSLIRSVEYLTDNIPSFTHRASTMSGAGMVKYFFEAGLKHILSDSPSQRARIKELINQFPFLSRTNARIIAEMDQEAFANLKGYINEDKNNEYLQLFLDAFQSGVYLTGIKLSTERIEQLVKSLKSYSRQTTTESDVVDIRVGIQETLFIVGNRLKNFQVKLELPDIPKIKCHVGELNQVWTNIIINACDAMKNSGTLEISCGHDDEKKMVWVKIADNGPGVPDNLKERIFQTSFTTKSGGVEFGLGLGLAISRGIVEKHFGTINVFDRKGRGAEFVVALPI